MSASPSIASNPAPEEVLKIVAIQDRVIRNLRITECYHRLSLAMSARTGACSNWCTFAVWASRQAGRTIRGEDLLERLAMHARSEWSVRWPIQSLWRALLRKGVFNPETVLGRIVRAVHSPFDAFERASEAVADGNLKVFEEIGFHFARYLQSCPKDADVDDARLAAFIGELRPGPPPDGQENLRQAFIHFQKQGSESKPEHRAQLILLANIEIGFHEQTRLQAQIQQALEVPPDTVEDLKARLIAVLPGGPMLSILARPLAMVLERYRRFARDITRRVITEMFLVLSLPGVVLEIGRHLDYPFPESLRNITDPELTVLCRRYEPDDVVCDNCGADDWADLQQRMHYIVHFFRAFHERAQLLSAPFNPAQIRQFMSGVVPNGDL